MVLLPPSSEPAHDRRLNALLLLSVGTALFVLVFAVIAVPKILASASTTAALEEQSTISGCRASYRVQLVDDPAALLAVARARLDERTNLGLELVARGDDEGLIVLLDSSPTLAELRAGVERAAARIEHGTARYAELIALSTEKPDEFIDGCRRERQNGGSG